jgi:hypothetical protein
VIGSFAFVGLCGGKALPSEAGTFTVTTTPGLKVVIRKSPSKW